MVLSFHPCFESDQNIICAGRLPDESDLSAIRQADAVILPQGCRKELFQMADHHCAHVFPDYHARFQYPGKIGQIQLFEQTQVPHPGTVTFEKAAAFHQGETNQKFQKALSFPLVFKFDWGGEGDTVFLVNNHSDLENLVKKAEQFEKSGQTGFMLQEYIPSDNTVLRVVVIGNHYQSYWRIQKDSDRFASSVSKGAVIDHEKDPELQEQAIAATKKFCGRTGINLAGFDFLFSTIENRITPLFLEINYFFGRRGIGGSEKFYDLLVAEIQAWIATELEILQEAL